MVMTLHLKKINMISSLNILKDKHKGKRIWICGSGPSLMEVNPNLIPKEDIIICCNSSTYHFQNFNYGVFTDEMANYSEWYLNLINKNCDILLCNERINVIKDNTIIFSKHNTWDFKSSDDKVICGIDVIHCATHIAWVMGASTIILVGVDLKHINSNQKYPYSQDLIESAPTQYKNIIRESSSANSSLIDIHLQNSLNGWVKIKEKNDLNILNISIDGNLKIYPTKKFEELITQ
jgi:hypothetical protein